MVKRRTGWFRVRLRVRLLSGGFVLENGLGSTTASDAEQEKALWALMGHHLVLLSVSP